MTDMNEEAEYRFAHLEELPLVSYRRRGNAVTGFFSAVAEVFRHRELLGLLVRRELVGRYKDSALGIVWALARPLAQLLIYYLVMGEFLGAARSIDNFAIFIFAGLTIYGLFSQTVLAMTTSVVGNQALVKKVFLPREIFPLAAAGASLFDFVLQSLILLMGAVIAGTLVFGINLFFGLVGFLLAMFWALGVGLFLAAANVHLRDVQFLTDVVLMLLMWFSPIVYSWTFVRDSFAAAGIPWLTEVYLSNPVTLMVLSFQQAFWAPHSGGVLPDFMAVRLTVAFVLGIFVLWGGQRYFAKKQANFAQEL